MLNRPYLLMTLVAGLVLSGCGTDSSMSTGIERPSLVTRGTPTGAAHPEVVLILMEENGAPAYRCTGTLISPTLVLTAGHCTGEVGEFSGMRIFTESDVDAGRGTTNNYPYAGPNAIEAKANGWHTLPGYTSAAFYLNDVGVIELDGEVILPASAYGRLPSPFELNLLKVRNSTRFTAVGYGLQRINPAKVQADLVRQSATPHLLQINTGFTGPSSMLLSNNASTGGTCFGDSGGPNYLGTSNIIAGVTSFGINGTCGGTGGVFRMDRPDVIAFVQSYLAK